MASRGGGSRTAVWGATTSVWAVTPVRFGRPAPSIDPAGGARSADAEVGATPPDDAQTAEAPGGSHAGTAALPTTPADEPVSLRQQRVDEAIDSWCGRLLELGGQSALADITQLGAASIDLTAAHPSGVAQLFAGRPTLLSNLVREEAAQGSARRRARTVLARADELAQRYGVAPTYLAIGIASWTSYEPAPAPVEESDAGQDAAPSSGPSAVPVPVPLDEPEADDPVLAAEGSVPPGLAKRTVRAPILLRPVRLTTPSDSDVDVLLEPSVEVNPVLVRALRAAGSALDTAELARATLTEHGFAPEPALRRLRDEGESALENFRFSEHLVLGPFVHPGQVLVEDLESRRRELAEHDVVAALAGDPDALGAVHRELPAFVAGDLPPGEERGAGDLDPSQQQAVAAVASGAHVFIDAPPGADVAQTLAGIVADAAAGGKHVLYVSGTRRAGQGLREAMAAVGLERLLLDLSADSRWRPGAGARLAAGAAVKGVVIDHERVARTRAELAETRAQLSAYITALHAPRPTWGVSGYDALQSLASLTSMRAGPRTTIRLDPPTVRALAGEERAIAARMLTRAAELGAFSLRPTDSPWFGAALTDEARAGRAIEQVRRLSERSLPALRRRIAEVSMQAEFVRADSLQVWGEQLDLLEGLRDSLEVFGPSVFDQPVAELAAATAGRQWRAANGFEMGWLTRRRLRRTARELLRPGPGATNLHAELLAVRDRLGDWRRFSPSGERPKVPEQLAEAVAEYSEVMSDIAGLEPVLSETPDGGGLAGRALWDLEQTVGTLAAEADALDVLPERTRLLEGLRGMGLGALLEELTERSVRPELVAAELELAWWSSVFEEILRADRALAGHDGESLGALADRLRELDRAQLETLPGPALNAVVERRREALIAGSPRTRTLIGDLANERVRDVREAVRSLGPLAGLLRPCWHVAPMQVPQLVEPDRAVDVVILDAAQHLPVEQAVSALSRATQVVVVGDSRRAALNAEGAPQPIVDALAGVLPRVTLAADRVVREPALMAFLGEHGYADVIRSVPTPHTRSALRLDVVDGFGMPAPGSAVVESVQAEVDRVVDLVIEHALTRPEESLVVLTVSVKHADRVREAVRTAVAESPALRAFFAPGRSEPFAVLELDSAAGVRRDAVILSLGLGKTPHGRVMHRFGRVGDPDGAGLLIDAIDACRRRLTVVSCFGPGELDRWRLRGPGPLLLADLLEAAEAGGALPGTVPGEGEPDQLLVDLAERLSQLGLTVTPRFGVPGGYRIPLVLGHPEQPDELLLAVLTDDAEYVGQPSLRIRDRHDVQRLADRGWGVHMAFSTAVFLDPQAEAENVLDSVRRLLRSRRQPLEFVPVARQAPEPALANGAVPRQVSEPPVVAQVEEPAAVAQVDEPAPSVQVEQVAETVLSVQVSEAVASDAPGGDPVAAEGAERP